MDVRVRAIGPGEVSIVGICLDHKWCSVLLDFLSDHLRKHDLRSGRPRGQLPHGMKSAPLYGSAGEMWIAYQEAEDPRKVLKQLKSRHKFPWKTLAFDQQTRPPYCGELML